MVTRRIRRTGGSRLSRPRRRGSIARRVREGRACRDRGRRGSIARRAREGRACRDRGGAGPLRAGYGRVALVATEAARVHWAPGRREGRACRDRGGAARTRKRHRTRGPPRTSAPTTAAHGNPADTAHGRVALVATEGGAGPLGAGHGRVALVAAEGGAGPLRAGPAVARERDPPAPLLHERGAVRVARAAEPARTPPAVEAAGADSASLALDLISWKMALA